MRQHLGWLEPLTRGQDRFAKVCTNPVGGYVVHDNEFDTYQPVLPTGSYLPVEMATMEQAQVHLENLYFLKRDLRRLRMERRRSTP